VAIVSYERGYLFVMAPRTGCTAIGERLLIAELDGEYLPHDDVLGPDGAIAVPKKHTTVRQLERAGILTREARARLLTFTAVRNPFDSLVSQYVKMRSKYVPLLDDPDSFVHRTPEYLESMQRAAEMTFEEWVRARYVGRSLHQVTRRSTARSPLRWLLAGWAGPRHMYGEFIRDADVVMRYERLQEDFDAVLGRLGIEPMTIPTWNVTEDKGDYRAYYTPAARRLVEHVFRPDLDRFGYTF
jgi:hypothetical protein